jgi:acetyl-CoA carboxylase biotin carboxyl carrier protein
MSERKSKMELKLKEVLELMDKLDQSSLREIDWQLNEEHVFLSKNETRHQPQTQAAAAVSREVTLSAAPENSVSAEKIPEAIVKTDKVKAEGEVVTSPLVGVVYTKPAPDKPDFVKVGDRVKKGQTLLIIEAMKVMNEIPADRDGIITEILVSSDDMVEYGQALVRIK